MLHSCHCTDSLMMVFFPFLSHFWITKERKRERRKNEAGREREKTKKIRRMHVLMLLFIWHYSFHPFLLLSFVSAAGQRGSEKKRRERERETHKKNRRLVNASFLPLHWFPHDGDGPIPPFLSHYLCPLPVAAAAINRITERERERMGRERVRVASLYLMGKRGRERGEKKWKWKGKGGVCNVSELSLFKCL